jgi:hypothetical protein
MNRLARQLLEDYGDDHIEATVTISGPPDTVTKILQVISTAQRLGDVGASREIKLDIDGDGHERLKVELEGGELPTPGDTEQDSIYCSGEEDEGDSG